MDHYLETTIQFEHAGGSGEEVENSSKCVFLLISMLGVGRVRIATILQLF